MPPTTNGSLSPAIWVADAATLDAREIWHSTNDAAGSFPELVAEQAFIFAAGNRVVFASKQDGWAHLYSVPTGGGKDVLLTPGQFEFEDVALSADKKALVYTSNQGDIDRRHLWRVPVEGGTPQATTGESGDTPDDESIVRPVKQQVADGPR